jgi:hypothetical protein
LAHGGHCMSFGNEVKIFSFALKGKIFKKRKEK